MPDEPRTAIRPTKTEPQCADPRGVSWPATEQIPIAPDATALISIHLSQTDLRTKVRP